MLCRVLVYVWYDLNQHYSRHCEKHDEANHGDGIVSPQMFKRLYPDPESGDDEKCSKDSFNPDDSLDIMSSVCFERVAFRN